MSYLLAIESSSKPLSVSLYKEKQLIEEIYNEPDDKTHSEKLLPLIEKLLKSHQLELKDLQSIAIAVGPGAFTSLRVGLATILGMTAVNDLKIYPISTLKGIVYGMNPKENYHAPLLKSGRGGIYGALYHNEEHSFKEVIPEGLYNPVDFVGRLKELKKKVNLGGPGLELVKELVQGNKEFQIDGVQPRSLYIAQAAFQDSSTPISSSQLTIRYLQEPDLGK